MPKRLQDSPELLAKLKDIDILYTDIDGTLLGRHACLLVDGESNPSIETAATVVRANRADFKIVPVSGRSRIQLTEIVRLCGWNDFIGEAGSMRSYWNGTWRENIYETPLWPDEIHEQMEADGLTPLELIRRSGALAALQDAFPGRIEHHDPWHLSRETTDVLRGYIDPDKAQRILDELPLAITIIENGVIRPPKHTLTPTYELIRAYHLAPSGTSKSRAIAADLERRRIPPSRAAMIGDGPADLQTAAELGLMVLVENALQSPGIEPLIEAQPNAAIVEGFRGSGWSKFVNRMLDAKGL